MSSTSDSDDDCYGNIAQKLQNIKKKFKENEILTTNISTEDFDDSIRNDEPAGKTEAESITVDDSSLGLDDETLDKLIAAKSKRQTRSSKRKLASEEVLVPSPSRKKVKAGSNRGRGRGSNSKSSDITKNKTKAKKRSSRKKTSKKETVQSDIPCYSVGNTDEYPDLSDAQTLFSEKKPEVISVEEDVIEENEELSVKVYWQSSEFFKFNIRRFQKLTQIFDYFATKENTGNDKLLFTYNGKILKPDDTPETIGYNIVKFIDGGIVTGNISKLITNNSVKVRNGILIKFQCQHLKKPYEMTVNPNDKFSLAMLKCAEHLEKPLEKLKFLFDGDIVSGSMTPKELELEGGECIDVELLM